MKLCFWLLVAGVILIAVSALFGDGKVFIFLFFIPVFYGTGALAIIGALFIILSFSLIMINFMRSFVFDIFDEGTKVERKMECKRKWGGILLLGPIPIIFGSDSDTVIILIILASILIAVMSLFLLLWY